MTRTRMTLLAASAASAAALIVAAGITPALADPCPTDPTPASTATCGARPEPATRCVSLLRPARRSTSRTPIRRRQGARRRAYGPDTCMQGFVWREAFSTDHRPAGPARSPAHTDASPSAGAHVVDRIRALATVGVAGRRTSRSDGTRSLGDPARLSDHPERHGRRRTTRRRQCALHLLATRLEAKPAKLFGVALPVLRDLDP